MTEGLSRKGFDLDLRDGLISEGVLGRLLAADARALELKQAHRANEYGAVFVEVFQTLYSPARASGLSITESQWWAWDLGERFVILPTSEMVRLTCLAFEKSGSTWGGDFNKFLGVRVPLRWLTSPPEGEPASSLADVMDRPSQMFLGA